MAKTKTLPAPSALPAKAAATQAVSTDERYLFHTFETYTYPWLGGWDPNSVRAARDAHMLGNFEQSGRLIDSMLVCPRTYNATRTRLAPPLGLTRQVLASDFQNGRGISETVRADCAALIAEDSDACGNAVLANAFRISASAGFWLGQNIYTPRADGSHVDIKLVPFPIRSLTYDYGVQRYRALTTEGLIDITPNDGKWVLFEPHGFQSFLMGAVRSLSLVWADRMYGVRDRSNHAQAHGSPKVLGKLPAGVPSDGPEGKILQKLINALRNPRAGGVLPNGTDAEYLELKSLAHKIFGELIESDSADIDFALLGHAGGVGNGGVYVAERLLDGVVYDVVKTDIGGATAPLNQGFFRPYVLINYGRDDVRPKMGWKVPDLREEARLKEIGERHIAFNEALASYAANGFDVDQDAVDQLAAEYKIDTAPKLPAGEKIKASTGGAGVPPPPPPGPDPLRKDEGLAGAA